MGTAPRGGILPEWMRIQRDNAIWLAMFWVGCAFTVLIISSMVIFREFELGAFLFGPALIWMGLWAGPVAARFGRRGTRTGRAQAHLCRAIACLSVLFIPAWLHSFPPVATTYRGWRLVAGFYIGLVTALYQAGAAIWQYRRRPRTFRST